MSNSQSTICPFILELEIAKNFQIQPKARKSGNFICIIWQPLGIGWIKINIHGSARGNPSNAACGAIFL
jgi:hypothetical protein